MPGLSAEEAAGLMATIRRNYRKHFRRVAVGERSGNLVKEVREQRQRLSRLLESLDGSPRTTWTTLLPRYQLLEERIAARRFEQRTGDVNAKRGLEAL